MMTEWCHEDARRRAERGEPPIGTEKPMTLEDFSMRVLTPYVAECAEKAALDVLYGSLTLPGWENYKPKPVSRFRRFLLRLDAARRRVHDALGVLTGRLEARDPDDWY